MNFGLSGATIETYCSTGISYWAVSGSRPSKASTIISRAWAQRASELGRGEKTKRSPP